MSFSKVLLLNPNLVTRFDDLASSGIPYWPTTLAYASKYLSGHKIDHNVLDLFGESPKQVFRWSDYYVQGFKIKQTIEAIKKISPKIIVSYAGMVHNHAWHVMLLATIRKNFPDIKIIILENTQQVTAYSLSLVAEEFFSAGADVVYTGEPEIDLDEVIKNLIKKNFSKNTIVYHQKNQIITDLDKINFPAWERFPIKNYWDLGYSHGPKSSYKYMPLYTSRGCPFGCAFCTIPELNQRLWRGRSGKNVVKEMMHWYKKYGATEFHFEDVNPGMVSQRLLDISKNIIRSKVNFIWKIVSGTKVEAILPEVIEQMAKAGCKYISISPESGSPRILKLMNKPFSHDLGLSQIKLMNKFKISTQACFVLGFPSETSTDRKQTEQYLQKLAKVGLDEFAPFIMTPIPGSSQWNKVKGYKSISDLTFSPSWRKEFVELNRFRILLFAKFIFWKFMYNPNSIVKSLIGLLTGKFQTKTEMTIHRLFKVRLWTIINNVKDT